MTRALLSILLLAAIASAGIEDDPDMEWDIAQYLERDVMERNTGYNYDPYEVWGTWFGDLRIGAWNPKLSGPIFVGGVQVLDLAQALNADDREWTPFWRATIGYDIFGLVFEFRQIRFRGNVRVQAEFEIDGVTFGIDETLVTDLDINQLRILPTFCLWRRDWIQVNLLAAIGLNLLSGSFNSTTGSEDSFEQLLPTAFIGVNAKGVLWKEFVWEVEVKGLSVNLDEFGGGLLDVQAMVGYRVWKRLSIRVGYMYSKLDGYYKILSAGFIAEGFFISLQWDF